MKRTLFVASIVTVVIGGASFGGAATASNSGALGVAVFAADDAPLIAKKGRLQPLIDSYDDVFDSSAWSGSESTLTISVIQIDAAQRSRVAELKSKVNELQLPFRVSWKLSQSRAHDLQEVALEISSGKAGWAKNLALPTMVEIVDSLSPRGSGNGKPTLRITVPAESREAWARIIPASYKGAPLLLSHGDAEVHYQVETRSADGANWAGGVGRWIAV